MDLSIRIVSFGGYCERDTNGHAAAAMGRADQRPTAPACDPAPSQLLVMTALACEEFEELPRAHAPRHCAIEPGFDGVGRTKHRRRARLTNGGQSRVNQHWISSLSNARDPGVSNLFTLYYAPHTCALASHIALEDAGASYTLKRINFGNNEQQSSAYMDVNPKGRVPAMVTPRGILTETPAMLAFIAQSFPQARLAPLADPFAFAQLQAFNSYLCSTLHVAHAHRMRGHRWADEAASFVDMQRKVPRSVGACYDMIEAHMFRGPWVMGEAYTIADPYLFTLAQWLEDDGVDPGRIPGVIEHRARMAQRPNVRKAIAEELAH